MSPYFDPDYFDTAYFDADGGAQPETPAAAQGGGYKAQRRRARQSSPALDAAIVAEDDYLMAEVI